MQQFNEFLVQQVAFRDGQDTVLVEHFRVELLQFIEQDLILLPDVVRIARHHEEQQGVALDMAEEPQSEPLPLACPFDDSRNIRHHETLAVTIADDAQRRFHGGKRIVGDLRPGT